MIVKKPSVRFRYAFTRMLDDYDRFDPENGAFYADARENFSAYVDLLHDQERGVRLPRGFVPCSTRWLIDGGEIVGIVRVRHNIDTPMLAEEFGHIGYDVPPSKRRRGYGVATLRAGLDCARGLGVTNVLLFADSCNPASWKTIERCDGVLESEQVSEHYKLLVRRYRIELCEQRRCGHLS